MTSTPNGYAGLCAIDLRPDDAALFRDFSRKRDRSLTDLVREAVLRWMAEEISKDQSLPALVPRSLITHTRNRIIDQRSPMTCIPTTDLIALVEVAERLEAEKPPQPPMEDRRK